MDALRKEYVLLFNALTDTEETLRQLCRPDFRSAAS